MIAHELVATSSLGKRAVRLGPESHYSLWSLLELLRFYAASFVAATGALARASAVVSLANNFGIGPNDEADRGLIRKALEEARPSLEELPLSSVLRSQFDRLLSSVDTAPGSELSVLVRELINNLMVELSSPYFLMIPANRRFLYQQPEPPFGPAVDKQFPDASIDISAAARCLALDEWTASVFHLMRVLEHGLRSMALLVNLPPTTTAHENWKNIIDQIERQIRQLESKPKSADKIAKLQELSDCAVQFRYFKDAWRNHVTHSRVTYEER